MTRGMTYGIALALGTAALVLAAGGAAVAMQQDAAAALRQAGQAGEQADGYMGVVGNASAQTRAQVDSVNIRRRALYTELAAQRRATIEEVAAATACEIFASRVGPGQYYRLPDGVWRQRNGNEPVPRPAWCS
ncbi:MAG: YdbL family protein [Allosphingosinicella sp.]|uniref:YdbL family protein n=1 Tax=Allosphingosinicella sp. TaxID=2823234 RepID=UPI003925B22B